MRYCRIVHFLLMLSSTSEDFHKSCPQFIEKTFSICQLGVLSINQYLSYNDTYFEYFYMQFLEKLIVFDEIQKTMSALGYQRFDEKWF